MGDAQQELRSLRTSNAAFHSMAQSKGAVVPPRPPQGHDDGRTAGGGDGGPSGWTVHKALHEQRAENSRFRQQAELVPSPSTAETEPSVSVMAALRAGARQAIDSLIGDGGRAPSAELATTPTAADSPPPATPADAAGTRLRDAVQQVIEGFGGAGRRPLAPEFAAIEVFASSAGTGETVKLREAVGFVINALGGDGRRVRDPELAAFVAFAKATQPSLPVNAPSELLDALQQAVDQFGSRGRRSAEASEIFEEGVLGTIQLFIEGLDGVATHSNQLVAHSASGGGGGGSYSGGTSEGGARHGHGVLRDGEGRVVYDGEWRAGRCHGHGLARERERGVVYDGEWRGGLREGRGVLRYPDGGAEISRFEGGLPTGEAALWSPSRISAWRLVDGAAVQPISCAEAEDIAVRAVGEHPRNVPPSLLISRRLRNLQQTSSNGWRTNSGWRVS